MAVEKKEEKEWAFLVYNEQRVFEHSDEPMRLFAILKGFPTALSALTALLVDRRLEGNGYSPFWSEDGEAKVRLESHKKDPQAFLDAMQKGEVGDCTLVATTEILFKVLVKKRLIEVRGCFTIDA